jgi:short-subunit dehydrogenase
MPELFITGASSGLGRGLALHYAKRGWTVHAAARRKDELEKLRAEAKDNIRPIVLDVQDHERVAATVESFAALDLVIANAGVGQLTSAVKMDWKRVKTIMDVNVTAACVTIAAALPKMVARNAGHVVAMSSLAAFRGMPGNASYCASKAALHMWMESIRVDLRRTRVKATTIYPGFVRTDMTAKNRFPMPFLMELDEAVRVMTKGLDRGAPTIAYPLPMVGLTRTLGALPRSIWEPLAGRARMF